ncbi:hypothetical protein DFH28DRAFT_986013 [Melampsora americana]|nr:hypothetical protein DFH28DRAFT_986013 [Melampsora americana]
MLSVYSKFKLIFQLGFLLLLLLHQTFSTQISKDKDLIHVIEMPKAVEMTIGQTNLGRLMNFFFKQTDLNQLGKDISEGSHVLEDHSHLRKQTASQILNLDKDLRNINHRGLTEA